MAAQSEIDSLIRVLYFPNTTGVMVDVGAAGPEFLSNSLSFRKRGWRVIAIEPNPVFCAAQRAAGHEVLEYACSDSDCDDVPFHVVDLHEVGYQGGAVTFESYSSLGLSPEVEEQLGRTAQRMNAASAGKIQPTRKTIPVKVRRLDTILAEHAPDIREIDLISIDVEGWELAVLRGLSFERYRPKVVILENNNDDQAYRDFMTARGYEVGAQVTNNEIYVQSAWLAERA